MALRGSSRLFFKRFGGLNSFEHPENVPPDFWSNAINVSVNANGSAEVLRSLKAFNDSVGSGNPIISMADYLSPSTHKLLFDIVIPESAESSEPSSESEIGTLTTFTINDDFTNHVIRTDQFEAPFISAVVNNKLFRVNEKEFVQCQEDIETFYRVGIDPPITAPDISYEANSESSSSSGQENIEDGIQFSYAYYNDTTKHCSRPSPISNRLDAGGQAVTFTVVASTEPGVDKLVFFATLDGGAIPYLLIDENADLNTRPNTSGAVTFNVEDLLYDTLTPEPIFNFIPPLGAQFLFVWRDRVFLLNFVGGSDVDRSSLAYSGNESTYIGQPGESWPPLNQISLPAKGEVLVGGIGTQVGALLLSDLDAYLISGYPTDKTSGPEATTAVSEHFEPLHWNVGTQSPRTIQNTPFGTVWLDQAKRLRLWKGSGFPEESGIPLRFEFDQLDDARLDECAGQWFQMGKSGGYYVMVGPLKENAGQRMFLITIYEDSEGQHTGYAISDQAGYSLQTVRVFNKGRLFMGGIDVTYDILDPAQSGDGWPGGTEIFFELILGNDGNFGYWHSLRFDGKIEGLTLTIRDFDEATTLGREITVERDDDTGRSWYGLIDEYGRRKILRFSFDPTVDEG